MVYSAKQNFQWRNHDWPRKTQINWSKSLFIRKLQIKPIHLSEAEIKTSMIAFFLVKMCFKNTPPVLVGGQACTSPQETNLEFSQKTWNNST